MQRARQAYKEQRKIFQVEGGYYDTLAENEMLSEQDEVLPEGFEVDPGTTLQSVRPLAPKEVDALKVGDQFSLKWGKNWRNVAVTSVDNESIGFALLSDTGKKTRSRGSVPLYKLREDAGDPKDESKGQLAQFQDDKNARDLSLIHI